jgi:hypothetical protein
MSICVVDITFLRLISLDVQGSGSNSSYPDIQREKINGEILSHPNPVTKYKMIHCR